MFCQIWKITSSPLYCMKSLQSIASLWWNEIIFYIKTTQHNRKVQSELQWLTFKMIRWLLEGERKQKKVHLTSQRSSYIETWTAGKIQVHSISKIYKVLSYNVSWRYRRSLHLCAEMLQSGGDVQYAGQANPCETKISSFH